MHIVVTANITKQGVLPVTARGEPKHMPVTAMRWTSAGTCNRQMATERGTSAVNLLSGACRRFLAACKKATDKLAVNLVGKVDLARLSPWMAAFTAGLLFSTHLM